MKWRDINYVEGYDKLYSMKNGKHSSFYQMNIEGEEYLLKIFQVCTDEKLKVIDRFRDLDYSGVNAFPTGNVYVYGRAEGYLCKYYPNAIEFPLASSSIVSYDTRYQATLDTTSQLRFLHQNGFIVNDIRLVNNVLSSPFGHGMLLDFEDMILEDDYQYKPSYYHFYLDSEERVWGWPTKLDDVKKQFLCNASLLLGKDFESAVICRGVNQFLEKFSFDKEISEFVNDLFLGQETLYFDEIAPKFQDEERVKSYIKNI